MTPIHDEDGCVIFHADCLAAMHAMADESVDVVVTSPPYNMGLSPGGNGRGLYKAGRPGKTGSWKAGRFRDGYSEVDDDCMDPAEYKSWQQVVLAECWRVSRMGVFYNHRPRVEHGLLRMPLDGDFGLPLRQEIIWDRGTGIDVNLRHFCTRQERIYVFAKPAFMLVDHAASGMGDVWRLGMEHSETGHPAPFPVSLPERCIKATGAQSVLDPFMGSGSTLVAAKSVGARGIGIDNSLAYCQLAIGRLAQGSLFA